MMGGQLAPELLLTGGVRGELEVQPGPLGRPGEGDEVERRRLGGLKRLRGGVQALVQTLQLLGEALIQQDQEQILLGGEVGVEGALGVARGVGDLVDRGAFETVLGEPPCGGVQQRAAGAQLLLAPGQRSTTSASWRGVSVMARRSVGSDWARAATRLRRATSSESTTRISSWAKAAPRQRRTPPPNGIHV